MITVVFTGCFHRPAPKAQGRRKDSVTGRAYLEKGRPVVVLIRWGPGGGPRNVLIRREDGTLTVRPFRGLRKPSPPLTPGQGPARPAP